MTMAEDDQSPAIIFDKLNEQCFAVALHFTAGRHDGLFFLSCEHLPFVVEEG